MSIVDTDAPAAVLHTSPRMTVWVQLLAAVLLAFAIVFMLTPNGAAVSPDSIGYLDIAAHIHSGEGPRSTDYRLEHAGQNRSVANATWPPLYPALLAVTAGTPDVFTAATCSAVLLAVTLFFMQRILSRMMTGSLALLAGLAFALVVPILTIHTYVWSEQLFIALLAALFCAAQYYLLLDDRSAPASRYALVAVTLLLVLVFYTRYIGILFFPLLPLLFFMSGRPRHLLPLFIGGCIAIAAAAVALMAYNTSVSGSLTGAARSGANSTMLEQGRALLSASVPLFLPVTNQLTSVAFAILAAGLSWFALLNRPLQVQRASVVTAQLALGLAVYYIGGVVMLRSFVAFDEIDVRLTSAGALFGWVGGIALIAAYGPKPSRAIPALLSLLAIAAMVGSGYFTLLQTRTAWRETGSPQLMLNTRGFYMNYNLSPAANPHLQFMASRTNPDSVLVLDSPALLQFTTGLTSYLLPKNFSEEELGVLTSVPPRSYMLVYQRELAEVENKLRERGIRQPQTSAAGDTVLIHLPLQRETDAR